MTQDEIRKLLGDYATDALSERERAALFEAALENQELFDALQNEDALRELLADPGSREQIRQALQPAMVGRRPAGWRRRWLVGVASLAVAAAIAIAVVLWQGPVTRPAPAVQMAQKVEPKVASPPVEPRTVAPKKTLRQYQPKAVAPAPEPHVARVPALQEPTSGVVGGLAAPAPPPPSPKQDLTPSAAGVTADANGLFYSGPLVRYSVFRSGPGGNAVRIEVVSQIPGSMALYRADADGQWQRIFPVNDAGVAIAANTAYQIPDAPIAVRDNREKLRLVIEPVTTNALNAPRAKDLDKKAAGPAPLVVEIPIGPN